MDISTTTPLPSICSRGLYREIITVTGGTAPYTYSVSSGTLPQGVLLIQNGELTGVATEAGIFTFDITVTDSLSDSASSTFTLEVFNSPTIQNRSIPNGIWNTFYHADFSKIGGTEPFLWNLESKLPPGLTFNYLYGALEGTPYGYGTYPLKISVTDGNGCVDSKMYIFYIEGPPKISTDTLKEACQNVNYSDYIVASQGSSPYLWYITSTNNLPDDLSLNPYTGKITGIPRTPGLFTFSIAVRDANKLYDEKNYSLLVKPEAECKESVETGTTDGVNTIKQKPRLISLESSPTVVKDAFHQKYLITYMPTPFLEEDK